jgi:uncharacterized membrane protein
MKFFSKASGKPKSLEPVMPWLLIIGGAIGLISSFVLTYDEFQFLKNPNFVPNCNLNPVISCGNVMLSDQAKAFGFPNPWIGLAAFAVLVTVGVALLAGAKFKRWFWLTMLGAMILGLIFALWLLFESVYSINALCPYCLAVDVAIITMLWYTKLYLVETKMLGVPARLTKVVAFSRRHHLDILISIFVIIIVVILNHFWYYYGKYF